MNLVDLHIEDIQNICKQKYNPSSLATRNGENVRSS